MGNTNITWLGHASASVEFNGHIIYFDPWLDENPVSTIKASQVEKATTICVTHGHVDPIGDSFQLLKPSLISVSTQRCFKSLIRSASMLVENAFLFAIMDILQLYRINYNK